MTYSSQEVGVHGLEISPLGVYVWKRFILHHIAEEQAN